MFVPRWVHATCQGLSCEDEVEAVADEGFDCSLCRSHGCSSYGEQTSEHSSSYHVISDQPLIRNVLHNFTIHCYTNGRIKDKRWTVHSQALSRQAAPSLHALAPLLLMVRCKLYYRYHSG